MAQNKQESDDIQLVKMDKRDEKLLALLRENARTPISELSKALGINRDTVKYRMTRLEEAGVIRKYYAEIDRSVFGYFVCYVFMLLDESDQKKQDLLLKEIRNHPNTEGLMQYNDKWDLQWVLVAQHLEELDNIIMNIATKYSSVILEKDTLVVVRWSRASLWEQGEETHGLDEKDMKILKLLSENARANAVELAQDVGLSSDAIIKRIKYLESKKIIRRFTTWIDVRRIAKQSYTLAIQMKQFDETHQNRLKELVRQNPAIVRCFKTIGTWDIVLYLAVDNLPEFHRVVKEIKRVFSDTIKNYEAYAGYDEEFITSLPKVITH